MTWDPPRLAVHPEMPHRFAAPSAQPGRSRLAAMLSKTVSGRVIRDMVQRRDGHLCRLCGVQVHGLGGNGDRRSPRRGTYVCVDTERPLTIDNVLVVCATCRVIWDADPGCIIPLVPPPVPVDQWWSAS